MSTPTPSSRWIAALILSLGIFAGLATLGVSLGESALRFKEYERSVTVKGLAEREMPADIVLWPIQYTAADNELAALYAKLEKDSNQIREYLLSSGIDPAEITTSPPRVTDKLAQQYGEPSRLAFRYTAIQTLTVYSTNVDRVRKTLEGLAGLGKQGIAFTGGDYQNQIEYLFTRLNEIKPEMVEEATRNGRSVALKFAKDSDSALGKIKRAHQGTFSITSRDSQTPYIKKIRVVSTIEYYLSD
jgi:hypothetical protein